MKITATFSEFSNAWRGSWGYPMPDTLAALFAGVQLRPEHQVTVDINDDELVVLLRNQIMVNRLRHR